MHDPMKEDYDFSGGTRGRYVDLAQFEKLRKRAAKDLSPRAKAALVRELFNLRFGANARKEVLSVGARGARHEFDLFEDGALIGGIGTSPWRNPSGTTNTDGRNRVEAEVLWLSLWKGNEDRFEILTDKDMATNLVQRFVGCSFPSPIQVLWCSLESTSFELVGVLGIRRESAVEWGESTTATPLETTAATG